MDHCLLQIVVMHYCIMMPPKRTASIRDHAARLLAGFQQPQTILGVYASSHESLSYGVIE